MPRASSSLPVPSQERPLLYKRNRPSHANQYLIRRLCVGVLFFIVTTTFTLQLLFLGQSLSTTKGSTVYLNVTETYSPIPVDQGKQRVQSPAQESQLDTNLLYNEESAEQIFSRLPSWIQDYVTWHSQMRKKFPGMRLFTHPDAPPVLVRTCLGLCGGLHDRLGQLPWDLYLANATKRVLLLAWQRPRSLENFLVPNHPDLLDWRVPVDFHLGFEDISRVRNITELFEGYSENHPTTDFWKHDVDAALERANTQFSSDKVLRHRLLGHLGEQALQERLNRVGEMEDVHSAPHFGRIFCLFFRPSPAVEEWALQIFQQLHLHLYSYAAVHCRVRHPKATSYGSIVVGKNPKYPADKTGLPWQGVTRQFALDVATQALNCSRLIAAEEPVYFLSDSNDLVRHIAIELLDPAFVKANRSNIDFSLYEIVQQDPVILSRNVREETVHLDRQKGRPAEAYYSTFVDLILVIHAHCVVYGVGYYAAFGAKISGTDCQYLYQQEAWGNQASKLARVCPNADRQI